MSQEEKFSTRENFGGLIAALLISGASLSGLIYTSFINFKWWIFGFTFIPLFAILLMGLFLSGFYVYSLMD